MQELMVISNPRRRRRKGRKGGKSRRRVSAKQRAARKRFAAMARSGGFKRRRRRAHSRRHSQIVGVNPMKKRRRHRRHSSGGSPALSFRSAVRQPMRFLTPALWGAVGAITVNTVMSRLLPMVLPANLQATFMVGRARYLTQALAAIGVGMAANRFGVRAGIAEKMAEGSLIVTMTDALRDLSSSAGIPLGGFGYYLPGFNPNRAVPSASGRAAPQLSGMNAYVTGPGASSSSVIPLRRAGMAGFGFGPGRTF